MMLGEWSTGLVMLAGPRFRQPADQGPRLVLGFSKQEVQLLKHPIVK